MKHVILPAVFLIIGLIIGGVYMFQNMDQKSAYLIKELEVELYYQSFEKHKEIYSALDKKDYEKAQRLLEKRMGFEFMVIDECVESNCLKIGISDVTKEWVEKNRSNKSLNQIGAKDAPPG